MLDIDEGLVIDMIPNLETAFGNSWPFALVLSIERAIGVIVYGYGYVVFDIMEIDERLIKKNHRALL